VNKFKQFYLVLAELGPRYVGYKVWYEIKRKSGILKKQFPEQFKTISTFTKSEWMDTIHPHFLKEKSALKLPKDKNIELEERVNKYKSGKYLFFNIQWIDLSRDYNWFTNPDSNFTYKKKHWTAIPSYSKASGDIKYVWEKSRFCFVLDVIRYDYHFDKDNALFVLNEIEDWVDKNPLNVGPNYVCSQETSLRLLNWVSALTFYQKSEVLTNELFKKIVDSIYGQTKHVEANLNFSRYLVRNNHAITECFLLFFIGLQFPQFKESEKWKSKGRKLLDKEILYQFYPDGGYIQYSHNYHRVAMQVTTWYLVLAKKNKIKMDNEVLNRLKSTEKFIKAHIQPNGWLPNYGANDGALFFRWNNDDFRSFGSQLNAFSAALSLPIDPNYGIEDTLWYDLTYKGEKKKDSIAFSKFEHTGFYILRNEDLVVYVRCGNHPDRPSQADNLHIDIWHKGQNVVWDTGSYKYNTSLEEINYFWGTKGHNTVQINAESQMLKGSRFLWHYWTHVAKDVELISFKDEIKFCGEIAAYGQISKRIKHRREIVLCDNKIIILDFIKGKPKKTSIVQNWHLNPEFEERVSIKSDGVISQKAAFCSNYYGQKENSTLLESTTAGDKITTTLSFT